MAKGYIDPKYVSKLIGQSNRLKDRARQEAIKIFIDSKVKMINEFDNHVVTKEINGGNTAQNESQTLNGQSNLFSFIGFTEEGEHPTEKLRQTLLEKTEIDLTPEITNDENSIIYSYSVTVPDEKEITEATKMPWESGKGWAVGIEKGISGFSHFLGGLFNASRSKGGIQSKHEVKSVNFKPIFYLSEIFRNFKLNLRGVKTEKE